MSGEIRSAELRESREELAASGEEARQLAGGLGAEALWWRPAEERWAVAECLDHLARTGELYLEALDESIAEGRRRGLLAGGPYRVGPVGRWLRRALEPPPGLKLPAPREIRPRRPDAPAAGAGGRPEPLRAFLDLRPRFGKRLAAADGLDLRRVKVGSPFVPFLRFDLGSAFRVIAAHERRHLWQARQVVEDAEFPG